MQTTATVKVGAAFLAGILVAMGGAAIYFHATNGQVRPQITVVESHAVNETPESAAAVSNAAAAEKPAPQESTPPIMKQSAPKPVIKRVKRVNHPSAGPVSLAVSNPPPPVEEPAPSMDPPPSNPVVTAPVVVTPVTPGQTQPQPQPQPHTVTIQAGTNLTVRLNEKLSTEQNYTGDTFRATLDAPLIMSGFIIADRGAKVLGRIAKAQKPGKLEGIAELSLVLTEISTTDGQRVPVETNESLRKGSSNTNQEVIKMAGGAALGAIIGAIAGGGKGAAIGAGAGGAAGTGAVLLGHGKPAVIASETLLTFELATPLTITEHLN